MSKSTKISNGKERRKYSRYKMPLDIYVNNKNGDGSVQYDISLEGVCFKCFQLFLKNDFILFHFLGDRDTSLRDSKFSILGRIIWMEPLSDGSFRYGAQFRFFNDPFSNQQKNAMLVTFNQFQTCRAE